MFFQRIHLRQPQFQQGQGQTYKVKNYNKVDKNLDSLQQLINLHLQTTLPFIKEINLMACSKYEYVKQYEDHRVALLDTYLVARIDGRGFTKFCQAHHFEKPNDLRAIDLMNESALFVCQKFKDIFLAYGQSDQYSFAFSKETSLFNRRIDKIQSCIVSAFSSAYVFNWKKYFEVEMKEIPTFDCRIITYPSLQTLKDCFRWRQVDCHINNLYNTVFWCLMKKGLKNTDVQNRLKDTNSGQKNQILFTEFQINYNNIEPIYRKGTVICYKQSLDLSKKSEKKLLSIAKESQQLLEKVQKNEKIISESLLSNTEKQMEIEEKKQKSEDEIIKLLYQLKGNGKYFEEISQKYKNVLAKGTAKKVKTKYNLQICHEDMIKDEFWNSIKK